MSTQHMFSWSNKKDISIFRMKTVPYLLLFITVSNIRPFKDGPKNVSRQKCIDYREK